MEFADSDSSHNVKLKTAGGGRSLTAKKCVETDT